MHRQSGWAILRLAALPRVAPAVLLTAWMIPTSAGSSRPWAGVLIGAVASLSLLVADRRPALPLLAGFAGIMAADTAGGIARDDAWLALMVCAFFCVGRFGGRRHQYAAATLVVLFVVLNLLSRGFDVSVGDVAFPVLFTGGPWLVGLALQTAVRRADIAADHAADLLASSAAAVDRATAEERLRIARDLHDVVAHNISALSLQAQTVRRRTELGHEVDLADLRAIEHAAQSSMTDLRRLLGVLRPTLGSAIAGPHEGLAQLPELVATARRVGQRVDLVATGPERVLPPALSLAAYRILQEGLANARKHAAGETVDVRLEWSGAALVIEVHNPTGGLQHVGQGNGVAGMTERARLHGGDLFAGPAAGGWLVRARLPLPVLAPEAR